MPVKRCSAICVILLLLCCGFDAVALDFYVSRDGRDEWSGALAAPNAEGTDGPFATLERARDEIRAYKKERGGLDQSVTVHVREGVYELDRPFELSAEDSGSATTPIWYWAHQGERVRLTGGRRVTGFVPVTDPAVLARLVPDASGHVFQADLRAQGITEYGEMSPRGFGRRVVPAGLEVFFNDEPMTLARWPNDRYVRTAGTPGGKTGGRFTFYVSRPERWANADDIWVHGFWAHDWADSYVKVVAIDCASKEITTAPPHGVYGYEKWHRYYYLNILDEIDEPGEWYLDREEGVLYFWPPGEMEGAEVRVSVGESLLALSDVSHVTLDGFLLDMVRGTAVTVAGGEAVVLADCTIRDIGNWGMVIDGGKGHIVSRCTLSHLGDGGIDLTGGDRMTLEPGGHMVLNSEISDFGRWVYTYRPAVALSGVGNRMAHNLIHDSRHMAVYIKGNDQVVEYNEIHDVCTDVDDAGAIYMGRDFTERGNVIRYNYIHHIGGYRSRMGVVGVYLDDWTSGTQVFGNVMEKCETGVLIGGGRRNVVENNIFVQCTPAVHLDARGLGGMKRYFDGTVTTLEDRMEAVNYRKPPYSTRYPDLLTLYEDDPAVPKYNVIRRNICIGGYLLELMPNLSPEIVEVKDNYTGKKNPGFWDREGGDFRLVPRSPAWKIGFRQIPMERIGLQR